MCSVARTLPCVARLQSPAAPHICSVGNARPPAQRAARRQNTPVPAHDRWRPRERPSCCKARMRCGFCVAHLPASPAAASPTAPSAAGGKSAAATPCAASPAAAASPSMSSKPNAAAETPGMEARCRRVRHATAQTSCRQRRRAPNGCRSSAAAPRAPISVSFPIGSSPPARRTARRSASTSSRSRRFTSCAAGGGA